VIILNATFMAFRAWGHEREGVDNDNQGIARWVAWPSLRQRHPLIRLKFMALSSRIGSAFGVKLKN
jgi:hypothetical protein